MARRACDGDGLLEAFRAAVANLEAHADEIDALNVYPVPDGDTGHNMLATARAALEEAERSAGQPAERIAAAISFGALMGARGNSGVITSQIFRGMAEGLGGKRRFNGLDLAHALSEGARTAYSAVAKPVEGTILTVIRESADAAVVAAERDNDIETVLAATVDAAERSVAQTPSLLAILREAGVVDAGGQGIYRLFQGALLDLVGRSAPGAARERSHARDGIKPSMLVAHADEGFGYETMFLLQPNGSGALDVDAIRDHLQSIGESVLVAGDQRALKVHVHNERPDEVIAYGLGVGVLSRISIENLDHQARDVRETRAAEFTGAPAGADTASAAVEGATIVQTPALGVVSVFAGDGLAAIFHDFGVAAVVAGGQSSNPSTGELLAAVKHVEARQIILLPNNPNVVLAARQMAAMADRPVVVVPTRNAAEGFAALLAMDPGLDAQANLGPMTEAARAIQTLVVTEAVRDATIGGRKVKRGQTIVLDPDDGLLAADGDRVAAVLAAVKALKPGFELLTLFYGDGADLAEAEALARRIGAITTRVEVEVRHGGQPLYRYLISAE
ncbi:MAG: fatty acid kinase [Chloroflexota bacterium]|nr:fatty acid kinase [Chloroflexota bacterium]